MIQDWIWQGRPAHFICAAECAFRLCTVVGEYIVSSVGAMDSGKKDGKFREIGCGRKFETFVFKRGQICTDCDCGEYRIDGSEIDSVGANSDAECRANHMAMCHKYDAKEVCGG